MWVLTACIKLQYIASIVQESSMLLRVRKNLLPLLALAALFNLLAGCQPAQQRSDAANANPSDQPILIKLTSLFNQSAPIHGPTIKHLSNLVERASGGSIRFKIYDPGKLVASMEVLDAVAAGKVDAGFSSAGFWMGKIPASPFFTAVPFGPDSSEFLSWLFAGNGETLFQEMYDRYGFEVKAMICGMTPPETSGWFAQEIESPEDLDGLKMRFYGLGGSVMAKLGVSVTLLPPGEIFPALEKRVIDATEYAMPSMDEDLGLYKIVSYNYFPGWHQQSSAFELLINKETWGELSSTQQTIIEMACRDTIVFSIALGEATQSNVMLHNERERGVKNITWPPEMLRLMKQTWEEVAAEQSAADPFFKKVYDDYSEFRNNYAVWGGMAYLPRSAGD